jgi:putative ABC transport system substrate-binding protein
MIDRRRFIAASASALLATPFTVGAQSPDKVWRIGYLALGLRPTPGSSPTFDAFLQGLCKLGYVDRRNVALEIRNADGRNDRFAGLASELVKLKLDVLVAESTPAAIAAKEASHTVPVVMVSVGDPVGAKLVDSLAHPGGNITGLSLVAPELSAKRLDLLKQTLPKLSRVAVLWNSTNPGMQLRVRQTELAAPALGLTLQSVTVQSPDDFDAVFTALGKDRPESLLVLADTVTATNSKRIVEFAARNRVPAIYEARNFVDAGGFMSYGLDFLDHYRRAASFVAKILRGTKPGDLPVEQPTKFEFVNNLKTAKALGLTIPPSLLARADEVIEQ